MDLADVSKSLFDFFFQPLIYKLLSTTHPVVEKKIRSQKMLHNPVAGRGFSATEPQLLPPIKKSS